MSGHAKHRAEHGTHPMRWAAVLGMVLVFLGVAPDGRTAPDRSSAERPPAYSVAPAVTFRAASDPVPRRQAATETPAPPTRVDIPALSVSAPVVGVAMDQAGGLTPPDDPQVLGWWSQGAPAGAVRGATLVTGHTVHTGGGALDHLEDVGIGATVTVRTERGSADYVVGSVREYSKGELARQATQVFSQAGPHRLVLVTCEDWNGTAYESNVVVTADLA